MLEQLALRTPKTFHATSEQDLNPRPCAVNEHPSVLAHEMMAIEPGEKPYAHPYLENYSLHQSYPVSFSR